MNLKEKVIQRGDLPYATVSRQLDLIDQLSAFELGRFLMQEERLSGYWTHYVMTQRKSDYPLEQFLLNRAPVFKAAQQSSQIFQQIVQAEARDGISLASIPSGLMGDLLNLNYSGLKQFRLTGIDLDPASLDGAKALAKEKGLLRFSRFELKDSRNLGLHSEFDLILCNGLSIYEPNDEKTIALYKQFHAALKKGGRLVTSFLTPPPGFHHRCEWDIGKVSMEDLLLQKILFADIIGVRWQTYRTPEEMEHILVKAGFGDLEILYDDARIFPTVAASAE